MITIQDIRTAMEDLQQATPDWCQIGEAVSLHLNPNGSVRYVHGTTFTSDENELLMAIQGEIEKHAYKAAEEFSDKQVKKNDLLKRLQEINEELEQCTPSNIKI